MEGKRDEAKHDPAKIGLRDLKKSPERVSQGGLSVPGRGRDSSGSDADADVGTGRPPTRGPAPGKNEKKVIYGAVDYVTGKLTYTVADSKWGAEFLAFLLVVIKKYAGQKVRTVCDNGRFHTTKAVVAFLEANKDKIEIDWLPPYCPDVNLIEQVWGHLNRTVVAKVLYKTLDYRVSAFRQGIRRATVEHERMGFMFDHDDLLAEIAQEAKGAAAQFILRFYLACAVHARPGTGFTLASNRVGITHVRLRPSQSSQTRNANLPGAPESFMQACRKDTLHSNATV